MTTKGDRDYDCFFRWSEEYRKRIPGAARSTAPDKTADTNVFINYALFQPADTLKFSAFTHREREGTPLAGVFDSVARASD